MGEFPEPGIYVVCVEHVPGATMPEVYVRTYSWDSEESAMIEEVMLHSGKTTGSSSSKGGDQAETAG